MAMQWAVDVGGSLCVASRRVSTRRNEWAQHRALSSRPCPRWPGEEADGWWDDVPSSWPHCVGRAGVARSKPAPPPSKPRWPAQQLEAPPVLAAAYGQVVAAAVAVIASLSEQLAGLEAALTSAFGTHRDAGIVHSQPGLGVVLAARVLAEFGDDPGRYVSAKAAKPMPGPPPSPGPLGCGRWCWPGRWGIDG